MSYKKLIAGLLAVAVIVTALTGCTGSQQTAINLVPQSANMVAEMQLGSIINDPMIIAAYNNASKTSDKPQTVQDAINKVQDTTGVNLQDFSKVLLFGDTNTVEKTDGGYMAFIAQGTFDETKFIQNLEQKTSKTLDSADYKGNKVYSNTTENYSLTFFGSNMLVFGSDKAVKDCIDVNKGNAKPLSGGVIDTFNKLGATSFRAAFAMPADAQKALDSKVPAGSALSTDAISKMDMVGFSVNKGTQDVSISLTLHYADATSAQDAKDTISGAVSMFKGITPNAELKTVLGNIQYTVSDTWMTVSLKTTLTDLQSLMKTTPTTITTTTSSITTTK